MKSLNMYLEEQFHQDLCYIYHDINESGGLYDGQIGLATKIVNDAESYYQQSKLEKFTLSYNHSELDFQNVFFNLINITFILQKSLSRRNIRGEYICKYDINEKTDLYKKYNYDKDNQRLNEININVICPLDFDKYYDDIRARISHELNHAYTYYEILNDDLKEIKDFVPDEYDHKLHKWANKIYSKISSNLTDPLLDEAKHIATNYVYALTRYERNAFLAEIMTYLFDNKMNFKDVKHVENLLEKSSQYLLYYKECPYMLGIIKNKWNDRQQKQFKEAYNEIYNTRYSFKKVVKILQYKLDSCIKKLNDNIKKICQRYKENVYEDKFIPSLDLIELIDNKYTIEWF